MLTKSADKFTNVMGLFAPFADDAMIFYLNRRRRKERPVLEKTSGFTYGKRLAAGVGGAGGLGALFFSEGLSPLEQGLTSIRRIWSRARKIKKMDDIVDGTYEEESRDDE